MAVASRQCKKDKINISDEIAKENYFSSRFQVRIFTSRSIK